MPHTPEDEVPGNKFSLNKLLITTILIALLVQLVAPGTFQIKSRDQVIIVQPLTEPAQQPLTRPTHFEGETVQALVSGDHPDSLEKGVLVADKGFEYLVPMNLLTVKTVPLGITRLVKHLQKDGTVKYSPFIGQMFYGPDMLASSMYYDSTSYPHGESAVSESSIDEGSYTPPSYDYGQTKSQVKEPHGPLVNPLAPDKVEQTIPAAKDPNVIEAPIQPSTPTPAAPEPIPAK